MSKLKSDYDIICFVTKPPRRENEKNRLIKLPRSNRGFKGRQKKIHLSTYISSQNFARNLTFEGSFRKV